MSIKPGAIHALPISHKANARIYTHAQRQLRAHFLTTATSLDPSDTSIFSRFPVNAKGAS